MQILLMAISSNAQSLTDTTKTINLSDAIDAALENNLDIQRRALLSASEEISLRQSKANLLPDLNGRYIHGINAGRSIDPSTNSYVNEKISFANPALESNLTLFKGLALLNTLRRDSYTFKAVKMEEQQAKDELALRVILAYLQVLTNEKQLILSENQKETSSKQLKRLEILHKEGSASPGEYYDLKGQVANDQMAVVNAANNLENSKLLFAQLLNLPYAKNIRLQDFSAEDFSLKYTTSAKIIYEEALQHLALIKGADLRKQSANENIKVARSEYSPGVFLNGALSSNYSSAAFEQSKLNYSNQLKNNLSKSASIGISIPLLNSSRAKNAVALARLKYKEADLVAKNVRLQLQQLTEQAYFNLEAAKERFLALKDQQDAFLESFKSAEVRFNAGVINSVDFLIAKNNLDRTNLSLVAARYDFILRKKILDFYQGKGY